MEYDKDLAARQEARALCRGALAAQKVLGCFPQEKLDGIVAAVAAAFFAGAEELGRMAAEETGFGNAADKAVKNRFASEKVEEAIRGMKVVGLLGEDREKKIREIGVPVGVIAAIVPSTNPTSTVCYKAMIALKSGNTIVFSPHPKALRCTLAAAKLVAAAAERAGAPAGCVQCLSIPAMAGCQELMAAPEVRLILATGGPAMVKAAYSSGKPAIGVGAGNGPAYIHRSADVKAALKKILRSKTFDYGTVCASEQSIIVERDMEQEVRTTASRMGYYFMDEAEATRLAKLLFRPNGAMNPDVVGKPAEHLAKMAGISAPSGTKILVGKADGVGAGHPYSCEKLCPVLGFYVLEDQEAVLKTAVEVLHHEGAGHTFSIHANDTAVVEKFALQIPVSRFLVNTPAALGGIGATTGLFPALTLGCGAVGGSASSNNIGPMDLVNVRRVAWGLEEEPKPAMDEDLVEMVTRKILERLK